MLKQTVNKSNIYVPVGVSQVSQLVVMILLINDCYVMSLVMIISRMNFVLYRNRTCEQQLKFRYELQFWSIWPINNLTSKATIIVVLEVWKAR